MEKIQELLDHELEQGFSDAFLRRPDEEGYPQVTDRLGKLYKIRSDEVLAEKELKLKEKQAEEELALKQQQTLDARKQGWIKIIVEGAAVVIPAGVYIIGMIKGFQFEENGTITSSTFRNLLQKFRFGK